MIWIPGKQLVTKLLGLLEKPILVILIFSITFIYMILYVAYFLADNKTDLLSCLGVVSVFKTERRVCSLRLVWYMLKLLSRLYILFIFCGINKVIYLTSSMISPEKERIKHWNIIKRCALAKPWAWNSEIEPKSWNFSHSWNIENIKYLICNSWSTDFVSRCCPCWYLWYCW